MNFKFNHFLFLFIVNVFFIIQCSAGSSMENDRLTELTERLDRMQSKIETQELEFEKSTKRYQVLEAECRLDIIHLKTQISKLESLLPITESTSKYATNSLNHRKNDVPMSRATTPPSSCAEMTGFANLDVDVDGIYLVQNKDTKKVEAVFCQFSSDPISQNLIGSLNVQKNTVHFYVQRNTSFLYRDSVIPFQQAVLNEGNAFNLTHGTFTAPVNGIYHFEFHAVKPSDYTYIYVLLLLNGAAVGAATSDVADDGASSQTISLSESLRLKVNDKVGIYNNHNIAVYDQEYHLTHFVGWLVEEDLM